MVVEDDSSRVASAPLSHLDDFSVNMETERSRSRICHETEMLWQKKSLTICEAFLVGGPDETRTRDPVRDRHVF